MKLVLYILLLALVTATSSCKEECSTAKFKELMGEWYKKKILFPAEIELLNKSGTDSTYWHQVNTKDAKHHIIHFFMADCDKCIHELENIQKFIKSHDQNGEVKYVFIVSGPTKKYAVDAIAQSGFTLPVYYEKEYFSFKKMNQLPLADRLYNTMLVDKDNQVILFGELFHNDKAEELFFNAINTCEH